MSAATLIVAALTLLAALAALGFSIHHHKKDVQERDGDRKRHLRDAIIQTALELDGNAQTSRIIALNALKKLGDLIPEEHLVQLEKGVSELENLTDMAEEMRKTYVVDDSSHSLEHLEGQLYLIREAALNVGTVMRQIELITERR